VLAAELGLASHAHCTGSKQRLGSSSRSSSSSSISRPECDHELAISSLHRTATNNATADNDSVPDGGRCRRGVVDQLERHRQYVVVTDDCGRRCQRTARGSRRTASADEDSAQLRQGASVTTTECQRNYDNRVRPVYNSSHRVTVKFALTLVQIIDMVSIKLYKL